MRPPKNRHIVALLRQELGLTQKEFAHRIQVHDRTVQAVELGKRKLSRAIAEKISAIFDFNLEALLSNQIDGGLRRANGSPWTNRTRYDVEQKFKRWAELEPEARATRLSSTQVLLDQFIEMREFFERHRDLKSDPDDVLRHWILLFSLAYATLMNLHAKADLVGEDLLVKAEKAKYASIIGDIQALETNLRFWTRDVKRQAKLARESKETGLKRVFAHYYGWNERGIEAIELARKLGFEKAANMRMLDFSRLLWQRLRKKEMYVPMKFDPFEAITQYHQETQSMFQRVPKK